MAFVISDANQCQKEKQYGNNADTVLNVLTDLERKSAQIMSDAVFLLIVPIMQYKSYKNKKKNDMRCPGYSNCIKNISFKLI